MADILEMSVFVAVMYTALIVWAWLTPEVPEIDEAKRDAKADESWHSEVDSCP